MKDELNFKVSAALKNIIGRDLINDDLIAVFELVKNSYDAHANKVEIIFEKLDDSFSKIIIKDNGKGMNYQDLINKWLFVAYSAKKAGTEENNYRDKIKIKRAYAGAKGIGRFSCDRLGSNLYLETIKDEDDPKIEVLITDWEKFEENLNDEFVNISVLHETLNTSSFGIEKGTVLEITNLRNDWDREKLLKLKSDLAKLINPNTKKSDDHFEINLIVESEKDQDQEVIDKGLKKKLPKEAIYKDIINGKIENLIFETLDLKTTKIVSEVSKKDKNIITTTLFEGGKLVYKIIEENTHTNLEEVDFTIYYLNQSAKATFSRRMGIPPVEYGHVFVYKNGLRIYPYGERGEDPLRMDNRKAQGNSRYLGTREVTGYIDIYGENEELTETSSRGDGLSKTQAYNELYSWFYSTLRRLERYIVEVSDWGKDLSEDDFINLDEHNRVIALQLLVSKLSKSKNIISIEYADDLLKILDSKQENSARNVLSEIKDKINNGNFDKIEILKGIEKAEKKISSLEKIKDDADNAALEEFIKNEELSNELEEQRKKGSWQGALIGTDKERIIGLQHQIFHSSSRINRNIKLLLKHLNPNSIDDTTKKYISVMSLEASKINSIANFVTKANFNLKASEIKKDLIEFIDGYLNEVYISENKIIDSGLKINISVIGSFEFIKEIRPLEITTLIDNFISNSEKAGADSISFVFSKKDESLKIEIIDNGFKTIDKESIIKIFDLGYTTTNGTGIGLYQARDIVNRMNGEIKAESERGIGTKFIITL